MFNLLRRSILFSLLISFLIPVSLQAQVDDVGVWMGFTIQKKLKRKLDVSLSEQLRLNHDVSTISQFLTDAGIEYSLTKKIKAGIHYRFINSNQDNYYSKRHRFYVDLSYKQKINIISLILRERIQQQFTDYYSSETGKVPEWVLRSKLTARIDVNRKYEPYLSVESYFVIDNAKEKDGLITRYRYEAGFVYDFNRIHSVNPFILLQHITPEDYNSLIYGITYSYSF